MPFFVSNGFTFRGFCYFHKEKRIVELKPLSLINPDDNKNIQLNLK